MSPLKPSSHLPLLYNPLLNCIFNNPYYHRSPFRNIIQELSENHTEYTILVPKSEVLQDAFEPTSFESNNHVLLKELCYNNEDFIRSHIIKTSSPISTTSAPVSKVQLTLYSTLSGKQILIKNGMIFTGKGFRRSLKIKILEIDYIHSFCEYFPKGSKFMVLTIDDSLFGSVSPNKGNNRISHEDSSRVNIDKSTKINNDIITFELLLRSFPLLSKAVSEKLNILLHKDDNKSKFLHYKVRTKLSDIQSEFHSIVDAAYAIILETLNMNTPDGNQAYNVVDYILKLYPGLDLNKLVHEYVETNLYDKIWPRIVYQFDLPNEEKENFDKEAFKVLDTTRYNNLAYISLNQLDISIDKPWQMNELNRRISLSVEEILKLNDINIMDLSSKVKILLNTVNTLSSNSYQQDYRKENNLSKNLDFLIDADMLLSLLIIVIIRAKVDNLEAHLYYVKNFSRIDYSSDGYLNYILNNFDAVILHLSSADDNKELIEASKLNNYYWDCIRKGDSESIKETLQEIKVAYKNDDRLPSSHFLYSRTADGESCLMLAIKLGKTEIFDLLINYNPEWFTIDDILFDRSTITNQSLLMTSIIEENHELTILLIDILKSSCTIEELESYFNTVDKTGRSVGHYLFHDYEIIGMVGPLINWELKDNNSHTPLFTLCRCYDHPDYPELLFRGFECVYNKYGKSNFNFQAHIDKLGNTLLHVVSRDLPVTKLLSQEETLIDVNQFNNKHVSPLEFYVKYNRVENLKELLSDSRLIFKLEDPQNFYHIFDYLGFISVKSSGTSKVYRKIDKMLCTYFIENYFPRASQPSMVALNAKYDPNNHDWIITLKDDKLETLYCSLEKIKQAIYLTKLQNELSIFPNDDMFWGNFPIGKKVAPSFSKLRLNKIIDNINTLFMSLALQQNNQQMALFVHILKQEGNASLVLDSIQHIKLNHEYQRGKLGKVQLNTTQVEEMEYFLGYSISDLESLRKVLSKLNKLAGIASIKESDVWVVIEKLLTSFTDSGIISNQFRYYPGSISKLSTYKDFHSCTMWLEKSLNELLLNINKVLDKFKSWKELHDSISEISQGLKSFELKNASNLPVQNGNSTETTDHHTSYFGFGNILENKKSKYKKLLIQKLEKIDQIMKLNASLKLDHEAIASEISNFMKFKSEYLRFIVKQYAFLHITWLKQKHYELNNLLNGLKSS